MLHGSMTDLTNLSTGIVLVSDPQELLRLNGLEEFLLLGEPGRASLLKLAVYLKGP